LSSRIVVDLVRILRLRDDIEAARDFQS